LAHGPRLGWLWAGRGGRGRGFFMCEIPVLLPSAKDNIYRERGLTERERDRERERVRERVRERESEHR